MSVPRVQLRSRITGVEKRAGGRVTDDDIALLLHNDADVYRPDGEPLLLLRRGAIPEALAEVARPIFKDVATRFGSLNRGKYAGLSRKVRVRPDGTTAKTTHTEVVHSAIIGFFDRQGGRFPFCRATAFTAQEVTAWGSVVPIAESVARSFAQVLPRRYEAQVAIAAKTQPAFVIPGTPFTTLTVNHNIAGRIHQDKGDFKAGFGCIFVLRKGSYRGGVLVFPEYRCGVDLQDRDLLFFNAHDWHAVTDFVDAQEGFERISVVLYFRERMVNCLPMAEELQRAQQRGAL